MESGKLFLVPTPIGNLKDITLRALEVLKDVDIIAAEDTRQSLKLLNHFEIKKPLVSYHMHNEQSKSIDLIEKLKDGKNIAIITDAGTPGISDPGATIVKKCIQEGMEFVVLPGATAFTTALIYSGLDTSRFLFRGFIPRETKERKILIEEMKEVKESLIFYESPHRLLSTLTLLHQELGNREISISRELTKLHEETVRGTILEVIEIFSSRVIKGEFVLVLQGKQQSEIEEERVKMWEGIGIEDHIKKLVEEGISKKEAIKKVAKDRGISKNEVYKYSTNI